MTRVETQRKAAERRLLTNEVKRLIAECLGLLNVPDFDPLFITDDQVLFGRGLELDSIDAAEISMAVRAQFNVSITDDNRDVLGSINTLADFIVNHMGEGEAAPL